MAKVGRWTIALLLLSVMYRTWCMTHIIPMGKSDGCDDATNGIDWDKNDATPYTCPEDAGSLPRPTSLLREGKSNTDILAILIKDANKTDKFPLTCPSVSYGKKPSNLNIFTMKNIPLVGMQHRCLNTTISYSTPFPASGDHRPAWPRYGSYIYIPPQRWLHSLEHGGIVGLYNPCASRAEIDKFKNVIACAAKDKFQEANLSNDFNEKVPKFILSPEIKTPTCLPFVAVAWRKRIMMANVDESKLSQFVKNSYSKGPEANDANGEYEIGLEHSSHLDVFGKCRQIH